MCDDEGCMHVVYSATNDSSTLLDRAFGSTINEIYQSALVEELPVAEVDIKNMLDKRDALRKVQTHPYTLIPIPSVLHPGPSVRSYTV